MHSMDKELPPNCPHLNSCTSAALLEQLDHGISNLVEESYTLTINGEEQPLSAFLERCMAAAADRLGRTQGTIPMLDDRCQPCILTRAENQPRLDES